MAKSENQKFKSLIVARILEQLTDENHPMTPKDIEDWMTHHGLSGEKKSILRDINQLIELYDVDVVDEEYGNILNYDYEIIHDDSYYNRGYKMVGRPFEYEDIQILLECIDNAKFISNKKANELKKKLASLRSVYEKKSLLDIETSSTGRFKPTEKNIIISMATINEAIKHNHKISFTYNCLDIKNNKIVKSKFYNGEPIIVSPFRMIMNDSFYYLICYKDKEQYKKESLLELEEEIEEELDMLEDGETLEEHYHNFYENADELKCKETINYRIDKMENIIELNDKRTGHEIFRQLDINNYAKECFDMFGFAKARELITIQFRNGLINEVADRFGTKDITFKNGDNECFYLNTYIYYSEFFFSWIMSFGGRARILKPDYIVDLYNTTVQLISNNAYFNK